ncbi:AMP-binding enzyme [Cricetibacter osteomyelitidis]|uniref:AMP-binding enzyme n=1 Tax=Cricetibacter osteomyelitidis TaxID=1521931 RepID=A0A4R2T1B6_9PAST|nr:AMP-binding protein [Cricetibacter osteomyelitidis]TCP94896.1 AMP-binding enzyme [Cricetibacter osteomyelitidis]
MNAFSPFDLSQFSYYVQAEKRCENAPHFAAETLALAAHLPPKAKVVLWFRESQYFIQALIAAWKTQAEIFVLPDLSDSNLQWANAQDYCLTDDGNLILSIPVYSLTEQARHPVNLLPAQTVDSTQAISPDAVLWLKTSGSSGTPKLIKKTLWQFQAEAEMLKNHFKISIDDLILNTVSQQHLYGLTFCIMLPLFSYAAICSEQWIFPEMLIEQTLQSDRKVTWIASPMLLNHFAEHHKWSVFQDKVCRIFSAGGKLPETTAELFAQHGLAIDEIYGSTETGVIATRKGQLEWQAMPSVQFRHNENQLNVMSNWIAQPESLNDVLEFKDENRFVLQGRQDRIMKLADKRISLDLVEDKLNQSDWVKECYCFKHPEQPRLIALTVLTQDGIRFLQEKGRKTLINALSAELKQQLGNLATPRFWRFITALPRNTQGKIIKAEALALFEHKLKEPAWQPVQSVTSRDLKQSQEQQFIGTIPLDLRYFTGHFADFPLVPGVVQLQWAIQLAESLGLPPHIKGVENLKYQQFIRPDNDITVNLRWDACKGKLNFSVTKQDNEQTLTCASGRIVYQVAE